MTLATSIPPEILFSIFELLVETEYDDKQHAANFKFYSSQARSLKILLHHPSLVCKIWRSIIINANSFWITRIIVPERIGGGLLDDYETKPEEVVEALGGCQKLLDGSAGSDLDIQVNLPWYEIVKGRILINEWIGDQIIPNRHLIRYFGVRDESNFSNSVPHSEWHLCFERNCPRLRVLSLYSQKGSIFDTACSLPQVRHLESVSITWNNERFPFSDLSSLVLNGTEDTLSFTHTIIPCVSATSNTLKSLTLISPLNGGLLSVDDPIALYFPRLTRLSINLRTPEEVWYLLEGVTAPVLRDLVCSSEACRGFWVEKPIREWRRRRIRGLREVGLSLPSSWFLPIFEILTIDEIEELHLFSIMEDENFHHSQRRKELGSPMRFKSLRNLAIKFEWEQGGDHNAHMKWLFQTFDFSIANVYLSVEPNGNWNSLVERGLHLPPVRMVSINDLEDLNLLYLSSVRGLSFRDWSLCDVPKWLSSQSKGFLSRVPLNNIDTLHIWTFSNFNCPIPPSPPFWEIFTNVHTLVLSVANRFEKGELGQENLLKHLGEMNCFPSLNTIHVLFVDEDSRIQLRGFQRICKDIKEFISRRTEERTVHNVFFDRIPQDILNQYVSGVEGVKADIGIEHLEIRKHDGYALDTWF